jgi:hypothetical protein
MVDTEFTIATSLVAAFAGDENICALPYDGEGAKTFCPATGATVSYRPGLALIQVSREGGGTLHTWLLSLRPDTNGWIGYFSGDTPTEGDLARLKEAATSANFNIADALASQDERVYLDQKHKDQVQTIIDAIWVKFTPPTVLARRGSKPGIHLLPGGKR